MNELIFGESVDHIQTRIDCTLYVQALLAELRADPQKWENNNLEAFLEALVSWAEDMDGYYANQGHPIPDPPTWKVFAEILTAATIYE